MNDNTYLETKRLMENNPELKRVLESVKNNM
jgi:hypothetical protein